MDIYIHGHLVFYGLKYIYTFSTKKKIAVHLDLLSTETFFGATPHGVATVFLVLLHMEWLRKMHMDI